MAQARRACVLLAWGLCTCGSAGGAGPLANFTGGSIPLVGFGCGSPFTETYLEALKVGYRHFDTAFAHRNHAIVGRAIRESGIPREEVFFTTKVSGVAPSQRCCFGLLDLPKPLTDPDVNDPQTGAGTYAKGRELEGVRLALQETGLDYIDLCLIHRPGATTLEMHALYVPHWLMMGFIGPRTQGLLQQVLNAAVRWENVGSGHGASRALRAEAWRQLEEAKRQGLCRHIGVSNHPLGALKELETYAREPVQVIQLEYTPICQFREILAYAAAKNIAVTGYGTSVSSGVLGWPLAVIAQRVGRTPNQVALRWRLQHGVGLLQGTTNPERMRENLGVLDFELSPADMAELDRLDAGFPFYFDTSWFDSRDSSLVYSTLVLLPILAACAALSSLCCCGCCCCRCCRRGTAAMSKKTN